MQELLTAPHAVMAASGAWDAIRAWDASWKIHPILVNFTAALVPVSLASDVMGRLFRSESLRDTGWWTMVFATAITPLTAFFGWAYWMADDNGVTGMTVHKWLGTGLAVVLLVLVVWRGALRRKGRAASWAYLLAAAVVVGALIVQGHLGGNQAFSMM